MRAYILWLSKLVTVLVLFFFIIPILLGGVILGMQTAMSPATLSGGTNTVAVIELTGMIENTKEVIEQLYAQAKNDKIKGIVLRIDSPGGAVGPSQDLYEAVKTLKARKPIIASMGALAASGGLYSALSASRIYAQPGTLTGSIGVIMQIPNLTKITEKVGVDIVTIKSGKLKDVGNTFRPMTDEEREFLQATILTVADQFISAVVESRNLSEEAVRKFADGRVLLGSQAKELGLIDSFGDTHAAARAVFEVLGTPLSDTEIPTLVYIEDAFHALRKLFRSASSFIKPFTNSSMELQYLMQ